MDRTAPDFSRARASQVLAWARQALENRKAPARVPWNGYPIPLPWALLGLIKRQNELSSHDDDFGGKRLDGVREGVVELLGKFLEQGGQFLDPQTRRELEQGDPQWLRPQERVAGQAREYLNPMKRWEKIHHIPEHTDPPGATPYINLLLLNDAEVTRAWMKEAMAFEDHQQPGRGNAMLLDLARGLIRLGEGPQQDGWKVAVEKIEQIYGEDWPVCDLGAGGAGGSLASELGTSWDQQRNSWLLDRFAHASDRCRLVWPDFSLGNFLLQDSARMLMCHLASDQRPWGLYVARIERMLGEHMAYEMGRGNWKRNRFGGLDVPEEDYDILSMWVRSMFRQAGEPDRIIDLLEVFERTCGLDVSGPHPTQLSDDDQRLLPAGWEQTTLAAAWKRRRLLEMAQSPAEGAPAGAPKVRM